ncbi:hypothetical protein CEK25_012170 [Fusarium fujikuroi]|nr:hypothetical protein CEK25_012170 [Fusarium fujikuroi]
MVADGACALSADDLAHVSRSVRDDGECAVHVCMILHNTPISLWARIKGLWAYNKGILCVSDGHVPFHPEWSKCPACSVGHQWSNVRYPASANCATREAGCPVSTPIYQNSADLLYPPLTSGEIYRFDTHASPGKTFQTADIALYQRPSGTVHIESAYSGKTSTSFTWQVSLPTAKDGTSNTSAPLVPFTSRVPIASIGTSTSGTTSPPCNSHIWHIALDAEILYSDSETSAGIDHSDGTTVQRLQALMRSLGTNVLGLGTNTAIEPAVGRRYLFTVDGRSEEHVLYLG